MKSYHRLTSLSLTLAAIGLLGTIAFTAGVLPALGALGLVLAIKSGVS